MPIAATPAKPVNNSLAVSPKLSILTNPAKNFAGRKLGLLITDHADAELFNALKTTVKEKGADLEIIAPTVGGVKLSDGTNLVTQSFAQDLHGILLL